MTGTSLRMQGSYQNFRRGIREMDIDINIWPEVRARPGPEPVCEDTDSQITENLFVGGWRKIKLRPFWSNLRNEIWEMCLIDISEQEILNIYQCPVDSGQLLRCYLFTKIWFIFLQFFFAVSPFCLISSSTCSCSPAASGQWTLSGFASEHHSALPH